MKKVLAACIFFLVLSCKTRTPRSNHSEPSPQQTTGPILKELEACKIYEGKMVYRITTKHDGTLTNCLADSEETEKKLMRMFEKALEGKSKEERERYDIEAIASDKTCPENFKACMQHPQGSLTLIYTEKSKNSSRKNCQNGCIWFE